MPGRLEFEHEVENEAELVVKDFEFGLVSKYGGYQQPEAKATRLVVDEEEGVDQDEMQNEKDQAEDDEEVKVKEEFMPDQPEASGSRLSQPSSPVKEESTDKSKGKAKALPVAEIEEEDELEVKLALLEIYFLKLDKREEAKDIILDRGLTNYKRVRMIWLIFTVT